MKTRASAEPQRQAKASIPLEKTTPATRTSTNGLGAGQDDFDYFLGMGPIEQAQQVRAGMEAIIMNRIASELLEIPLQALLTALRLPSSTINRKISSGERLSAGESDRAARTVLIYGQARDVLEQDKLAAAWLQRPSVELGGERPLDMLDTQAGYDRVRDILVRLEHGVGV